MESHDSLQRQWELLTLVAGNGATIKSLASRLEVSEKTIRRDLNTLRHVGFPVGELVGEFGCKTFVLETEQWPRVNFTYDEALALFLSRRAMEPWRGSFVWEAMEHGFAKIRAALGDKVANYVERLRPRFQTTGLHANYETKGDLINQLTLAIEECKATFITYHSSSSTEPVTYDVHPYGIADHQGSLYLVGFSVQHDEVRHWKLDRMLAAEATKVPFQRPADFDLREHLSSSFGVYHGREEMHVKIRFDASAARYVQEKRKHASQQVTIQPDGSAIVEFHLTNTPEIKSWILSFGPTAEVLEPVSLREEIRSDLRRMVSTYEPDAQSTGRLSAGRKSHHKLTKKHDRNTKPRGAK